MTPKAEVAREVPVHSFKNSVSAMCNPVGSTLTGPVNGCSIPIKAQSTMHTIATSIAVIINWARMLGAPKKKV